RDQRASESSMAWWKGGGLRNVPVDNGQWRSAPSFDLLKRLSICCGDMYISRVHGQSLGNVGLDKQDRLTTITSCSPQDPLTITRPIPNHPRLKNPNPSCQVSADCEAEQEAPKGKLLEDSEEYVSQELCMPRTCKRNSDSKPEANPRLIESLPLEAVKKGELEESEAECKRWKALLQVISPKQRGHYQHTYDTFINLAPALKVLINNPKK
ncbi:hypothetical protein L210DRAFT_936044, partial [Boletus edulis BED1]